MHGPREVLNELKWTGRLEGVRVTVIHRGAPGDVKVVDASSIRALGSSFFDIDARPGASGSIPYHRVVRIERDGEVVWSRRKKDDE